MQKSETSLAGEHSSFQRGKQRGLVRGIGAQDQVECLFLRRAADDLTGHEEAQDNVDGHAMQRNFPVVLRDLMDLAKTSVDSVLVQGLLHGQEYMLVRDKVTG